MQPFGRNIYGPKMEGALWGTASWVPIQYNVASAEAYGLAKFHLDRSNRLATVHQSYRQTGHDRQDNGPIAEGETFLGDRL